nr:unnamed protein product [Spirometra erinaceieuropaei]
MYVRRKNCEYGRIKRTSRKNKTCDTFSTNFGSYLKLLLAWAAIMTLDFLMEFRFEYMWPCWLLMRTINDSFKYQGLAFAIFFTLIALTSDLICYMLVPSSWLFLFGSTCVWIELVWHAERGICVPTVALCFLFLYMEVAVRLRDPKSIPLSIDLCRPFAAHCIGYPVVTLGFGLKSLLSHQFRLHRQRQVQSQNLKYFYLLESALPEEARSHNRIGELANGELPSSSTSASVAATAALPSVPSSSAGQTNLLQSSPPFAGDRERERPSAGGGGGGKERSSRKNLLNGKSGAAAASGESGGLTSRSDAGTSTSRGSLHPATSPTAVCDSTLNSSDRGFFANDSDSVLLKGGDGCSPSVCSTNWGDAGSPPPSSNSSLSGHEDISSAAMTVMSGSTSISKKAAVSTSSAHQQQQGTSPCSKSGRGSQSADSSTAPQSTSSSPTAIVTSSTASKVNDSKSGANSRHKDSSLSKLEEELRRLRSERQSLHATEVDLRSQVARLTAIERASLTENSQMRQELEQLQSKLSSANQRLQTERNNLQALEKRLAEERRQRTTLEQQLVAEKRARKEAEEREAAAKTAPAPAQSSKAVSKLVGTNRPGTGTTAPGRGAVGSPLTTANANACTSETCSSRLRELEAQLKSVTRDLAAKEVQLASLRSSRATAAATSSTTSSIFSGSGGTSNAASSTEGPQKMRKQQQQQQQQQQLVSAAQTNTERRISELAMQLSEMQEENMRLTAILKGEDKMKQELLTAYHTSLKEITELTSTLTRKEFQIVDLSSRLDGLVPPNCDYLCGVVNSVSGGKSASLGYHHSAQSNDPSSGSSLCRRPSASDSYCGGVSDPIASRYNPASTRHIPYMNGSGNGFGGNAGADSGASNSVFLSRNSDLDSLFAVSDFGGLSSPSSAAAATFSSSPWPKQPSVTPCSSTNALNASLSSSCTFQFAPNNTSAFDSPCMDYVGGSGAVSTGGRNGFSDSLLSAAGGGVAFTRSHASADERLHADNFGPGSLLSQHQHNHPPPSHHQQQQQSHRMMMMEDEYRFSSTGTSFGGAKRILSASAHAPSPPPPPASSSASAFHHHQQQQQQYLQGAFNVSLAPTSFASHQQSAVYSGGGPENMSTPAYLNQLRSQLAQTAVGTAPRSSSPPAGLDHHQSQPHNPGEMPRSGSCGDGGSSGRRGPSPAFSALSLATDKIVGDCADDEDNVGAGGEMLVTSATAADSSSESVAAVAETTTTTTSDATMAAVATT